MRLLTPGIDEYRPLAFRANDLLGIRQEDRTPAQARELNEVLNALAPIISQWSDPRSLGYQAQVHASFMLDPATWPSHEGKAVLWHECAHGNWFFLPWHRAYLLEFEAVVREHIKTLGGPHETWALPYWNSSDYISTPQAASLPAAAQDETLPSDVEVAGIAGEPGKPRANPLHEPSRDGPRPLRGRPSSHDWPDASEALLRLHYSNAHAARYVSFAGGYLDDLTRFHSFGHEGQLDLQPHGQGHVETGGFMGNFFTAGLDPVFWMHHANVDRLWETYARDLGHGYPFPEGRPTDRRAAAAYDTWVRKEFLFLRPDGEIVAWTSPRVLDVDVLGYRYETTAPPTFNAVPPPPAGQEIEPFGLDASGFSPVAAASNVELAATQTIVLEGGDGQDGSDIASADARWNIRFDGIRCARPALTSYAVYLELGDEQTEDSSARLIGALSLFGIFESSIAENGDLGGSRLFDATSVAQEIPGFDPFSARLTLVPSRGDRDLDSMGLRVDRISLELG